MLPPPRSPDPRVCAVQDMLETTFVFLDFTRHLAASFGMTTEQFEVIFYLGVVRPRGLSMAELRVRTYRQGPDLSRRVAGLEKMGLVMRRPQPQDRRAMTVYLTPAGRDFLAAEMRGFCARVASLAALQSDAEAATLIDVFARIRAWSDAGARALAAPGCAPPPGASSCDRTSESLPTCRLDG